MVKEIICKNGEIALCDDEDYPLLSRFSWYMVGGKNAMYAGCFVYGMGKARKHIFMHQLVMGGTYGADHIDLNKLNNQKSNLRPATRQQNNWNRGKTNFKSKPSTSQFKGVRREIKKGGKVKWCAYFKHVEPGQHKSTGKWIWIGRYDSEVEAAKAYNREIVKYRGEYAWVNPIPAHTAQHM